MADVLYPIAAILGVIKDCSDAKKRVKQNKRKSALLVDSLEAIEPILLTIDKQELAGTMAHRETLEKLKKVVEDAHALLQKQFTRSGYLTKMMSSSSVADQFAEIDARLANQMRAMTLSVGVLNSQNSGGVPAPAPAPAPAPKPEPKPKPTPAPALTPAPAPNPQPVDNDDVEVLRSWRELEPGLQRKWRGEDPEKWDVVTFTCDRVSNLYLTYNQLTSVPAEIGQLTSLKMLYLMNNQLTSLPAEIGQLTSLRVLALWDNKLTSVPEEIGQLTSLEELLLSVNQLKSLPAEIGQLTSLRNLYLNRNQLTSVPAEIGQLTSLEKLRLDGNQLTSLPAEIWQLTSLRELNLEGNQLTSVPAEIGQLTSLVRLDLSYNQLTNVPAAISDLQANGCDVYMASNDVQVPLSDPRALGRLAEELKVWRKDPLHGFVARPETVDGAVNLLRWECSIPGKKDTLWFSGHYPLTMEFSEDYPFKPPKCKFPQGFFHPSGVYPSGTVCLSILHEDEGWRPSITVKQILLGIQDMLDSPNPASPSQSEAYLLFKNNRADYDKKVKEQATRYPAL